MLPQTVNRHYRKKWHRTISPGRLAVLMGSLGTCWTFVFLILINIDIVGRTLFNAPLRGVIEIVGMTVVPCIYLKDGGARNDPFEIFPALCHRRDQGTGQGIDLRSAARAEPSLGFLSN